MGCPETLSTDQDREFVNELSTALYVCYLPWYNHFSLFALCHALAYNLWLWHLVTPLKGWARCRIVTRPREGWGLGTRLCWWLPFCTLCRISLPLSSKRRTVLHKLHSATSFQRLHKEKLTWGGTSPPPPPSPHICFQRDCVTYAYVTLNSLISGLLRRSCHPQN